MKDWAKKEIELAIKNELKGKKDDGTFNYGVECYKSAYKALESLIDDEHSGSSIHYTKSILNRLIDGKPLTPIEDIECEWNIIDDNEEWKMYQSKRMSSLFKYVYKNGAIKYRDVNRVVFIDEETNLSWSNGNVTDVVDNLLPISMPYFARNEYYYVYGTDFDTEAKHGYYDTMHYNFLKTPNNETIELNLYFKDGGDGKDIEITKEEYLERKNIFIENFNKINEMEKQHGTERH